MDEATLHDVGDLSSFAVLHKNLKKLEVLYVVTSLRVPSIKLRLGTFILRARRVAPWKHNFQRKRALTNV